MELAARVKKTGDCWIAEVPEVPGLSARARKLNEIVDALAAEYEILRGSPPQHFVVALEVDGESWRMYRPHWPVRSKWKDVWLSPVPATGVCENKTQAWLETGGTDI
ncbi:hypothetical protein [Arthrobacter sp. USHLN218]|uniref:hypothetical protein n=1 Tax=Arthrobacter sp. USHLN218 TaxID=3081232 RepID=UPI0030181E90